MSQAPAGTPYYDNYAQASSVMNIPVAVLKRCKKMGAIGFKKSRIYPNDFLPWYNEHKAEVEAEADNTMSMEDIRKENAIKDGVLKDLEIKKRRREYLDPTEVKTLLQTISTSQAAVLKRFPAELAPKLTGKTLPEVEKELSKAVVDIISIFKLSLDKWK